MARTRKASAITRSRPKAVFACRRPGRIFPVRKERQNVTILTKAHTKRVLLDGNRATGVVYDKDGREQTVTARREVILSAGAINSPQILMLSGIGDGAELQAKGM
jgi:choline dehydrogenase